MFYYALDVLSCSCENKTQATWTVKDEIYLGSEGRFDFLHLEIWYGDYH